MKQIHAIKTSAFAAAFSLAIIGISGAGGPQPDPDGKPADMSRPVQVYLLMGPSNMVGAGKVPGDKDGTLTPAVQVKDNDAPEQ